MLKNIFQGKNNLAKKQETRLIALFQDIVDNMDFISYKKKYIDGASKIGSDIMLFYSLPKTELHRTFRQKILTMEEGLHQREKEKKRNEEVDQLLRKNVEDAKYDPRTKDEIMDDETWRDIYRVCRKYHTSDGEYLILIGIPYELHEKGKSPVGKYAFTLFLEKTRDAIKYARFDK